MCEAEGSGGALCLWKAQPLLTFLHFQSRALPELSFGRAVAPAEASDPPQIGRAEVDAE